MEERKLEVKHKTKGEIAKRLKESEKKLEKELTRVEPVKKTLDEVLSTTTVRTTTGNESNTTDTKVEKGKVRLSYYS